MNLRNKPCSCLSGKKFKHCCGNQAKLNEQRREEDAKELEAMRARAAEIACKQEERRKAAPETNAYRRRESPMLAAMMMAAAFAGSARRDSL